MALNSAVTDANWSPNFSSGRPAGDPTFIVIHHWGVDGQSHQGVVNYLCRPNGDSSAHYVASAGRVTQLVHDYDRAWHAGSEGNPRGIGIECRPEMSDADFETVARLVAAIRSEWGNLPLHGHREYMQTACPGRWFSRLSELSARANQITNPGIPAPVPTPSTPNPAPAPGKLVEDGLFGDASTRKLQALLGTPADGVISGQWPDNAEYMPGWSTIEYDDGGSQAVIALQRKLGYPADGYLGPDTIKIWQRKLGVDSDGYFGHDTALAVQKALNAGRLW